MPLIADGGNACTPQKLFPRVTLRALSILLPLARGGEENRKSGVNDSKPGRAEFGDRGGTAMKIGRNAATPGDVAALRT